MDRQTFTWGRSGNTIRRKEPWVDGLFTLGLLLAALLLFCIYLGSPPLQDWGEGTLALVAREISRTSWESGSWLYPTFMGKPYFAQPPLIYWLVAGAYKLVGINEWTTRLPGAILSALSVPLLYGIGREIFPSRQSAIFSCLIYLTLLPVVCHGRLAMVDGATLCFVISTIWCVVRSRRDLRWSLGVGIGLGLICLTKGVPFALLMEVITLVFLGWDTPRLLTSVYWWLGFLLGLAPWLAWYTAGLLQYGEAFITVGLDAQSVQHFWTQLETYNRSPWYYLIELLKFSPWFIFFPYALRFGWEHRNWGWGKLVLVWAGIYLAASVVLVAQLPWFIIPVYPALALASGTHLAEVWSWPSGKSYPRFWSVGLALLAIGAIALGIYFGIFNSTDRSLSVIFASVALTMAIAAVLVDRRDLQFILILFWGMYVSLLLFMTSPHWTWQLKNAYPVEAIAAILQRGTLKEQPIYASFPEVRPSLSFYSERRVIPASVKELKEHWQRDRQPYLLLDNNTFKQLNLTPHRLVGRVGKGKAPDWVLVTKYQDID
jgi:4-amino-4-deoxy-L-arabinose transferase-like glycosyltransferase